MTQPVPQQRAMTGAEWLMLLALSVLWGCSFLFSKIAVTEIPPFTLVFGRVALASLTLTVAMRVMGVSFPKGRLLWLNLLGMGTLNNIIPFSLMFWGQTQIGAGLASILNATTPIFTVLVAHALTRDEKLTPARGLGVLLGFLGVVVMLGPELLLGLDKAVLAEVALLGGAMSYACSSVFGRRFARLGVQPAQAAFGQLAASTLVMAPVALIVDRPWTLPVPGVLALSCLVALAVLCTAVAYILFFRILGSAGATNIMLVTFLIPPSAIMLGAVVLGERLAARDFAGLTLVALGLAAIDRRSAAFATRFWRTGRRVPVGP
jgi:drug/metabolite transporter (DMT)-like permease